MALPTEFVTTVLEADGERVYALAKGDLSCASALTVNRAIALQREGTPYVGGRGGGPFLATAFDTYFARDWA